MVDKDELTCRFQKAGIDWLRSQKNKNAQPRSIWVSKYDNTVNMNELFEAYVSKYIKSEDRKHKEK